MNVCISSCTAAKLSSEAFNQIGLLVDLRRGGRGRCAS